MSTVTQHCTALCTHWTTVHTPVTSGLSNRKPCRGKKKKSNRYLPFSKWSGPESQVVFCLRSSSRHLKSTFCTERKAEMCSLFLGTMSANQPSSQRFDSHSEIALTYLPAHRLQQNNSVIIVPLTPPNNSFHVFSATKKLNVIWMLISAHQLKLKN